jgi:putative restriction endonuclease
MSYTIFDSSDVPYLEWLRTHPEGYVLNTRRGKGAHFAMVHLANCSHIASTAGISDDGYTMRDDIKVCALEVEELITFVKEHKSWSRGVLDSCRTCRATLEPIIFVRGTPAARKNWTRDELLVLLNLYEKIPFGKFDQGNPVLIDVAARMERTPGSVAMKLSNLASLDDRLAARGIKGLSGASALDRAVWTQFHGNYETLVPESEALLAQLITGDSDVPVEVRTDVIKVLSRPEGPTEAISEVKVRRGQRFFRQAVMNAYGGRCAVTGLSIRELLIASHIIPWSEVEQHRLDPQNGIALNVLHDRAFDEGLITFDADLRLVLAPSLRDHFANATVAQHFQAFEGTALNIPAEAAGPKAEYLEWHRQHLFGR